MNEQRPPPAAGNREAIGVMIVDDREVVRSGLATFLEAFDDLCLVGEAANGGEAMRLCAELKPDVVLMDLAMPGMDGVAAIRALRQAHPDIAVVGLTSFGDQYRAQEALQAGAACCLGKDVPIDQLARAIRDAYSNGPAGRALPPGPAAP